MIIHDSPNNREGLNKPSTGRTIEISLGDPETSGTQTNYKRQIVQVSDLPRLMKEHNYSPIIWSNDYRLAKNFDHATGFCVDIDKEGSIETSVEYLHKKGWNYALSTTRSHTPENHRFRIFLPFNRIVYTLSDYNRIVNSICDSHFSNNDPKVRDGARQLYFSPANATQLSRWDLADYDVDADIRIVDGKKSIRDAWTGTLRLVDGNGNNVLASAITEKTVIHCPFHDDSSPSAFIQYARSASNWFIFCSGCGKTYWKEKPHRPIEELCERFYSFQTDVFEATTVGDKFVFGRVGRTKLYIWTEAEDERAQKAMFAYIVKEKHLPCLSRIDYVGDMSADKTFYKYEPNDGSFIVYHAPIAVQIQDNAFIETWLKGLFGDYTEFIKQWLAAYCYTNYRKLPNLVLRGPRGSGKSRFAEAVMAIYPSISQMWHGEDKNFTPEVQNKLLVADESVSANERQYRKLKQLTGQKFAMVNEKHIPQYQVRNNTNIIILSNDHTPIFVRRDELPTSDKNNQFFVYEFKPIVGELDPDLASKIEARLGYYVRTELKTVYEGISKLEGCRYVIPTPITDAERALFDVNVTGLEAEADKFLRKMVEIDDDVTKKFFAKGLFPTSFIDRFDIAHGYTKTGIIRNLKERGYLEPRDPVRAMVDGRRDYCLALTEKTIAWLKAEESEGKQTK